jgi:hypothetical protein
MLSISIAAGTFPISAFVKQPCWRANLSTQQFGSTKGLGGRHHERRTQLCGRQSSLILLGITHRALALSSRESHLYRHQRNRGTGRVFKNNNRMIRPSQSCAPSYDYSLSFNEITELSKSSLLRTAT